MLYDQSKKVNARNITRDVNKKESNMVRNVKKVSFKASTDYSGYNN